MFKQRPEQNEEISPWISAARVLHANRTANIKILKHELTYFAWGPSRGSMGLDGAEWLSWIGVGDKVTEGTGQIMYSLGNPLIVMESNHGVWTETGHNDHAGQWLSKWHQLLPKAEPWDPEHNTWKQCLAGTKCSIKICWRKEKINKQDIMVTAYASIKADSQLYLSSKPFLHWTIHLKSIAILVTWHQQCVL